ncbi:MAG: GTPase ObgE [Candidatus Omnitrophota bacterium]
MKNKVMFVDRAKINVKAGNGGNGCESFCFKKGMRHRHRDGGDGGKGGDIIIKSDNNVHTLLDFKYRQHFKADSGKHGSSNLKRGRDAQDCVILVPAGTIIRDIDTGFLIRDLNQPQEQVVVCYGGVGGKGNAKLRSATLGSLGQELTITLELKLIADVGLIGFPNAGKSSFLNVISKAKSKVAQFPFTTLNPILGVVTSPENENRFVVADIPGLIKDAHRGKGLGIQFLRHIERTKLLLFIIDMAGVEGRDPVEDYYTLLKEIESFDRTLLTRPCLLVANKNDLKAAEENLKRFKLEVKKKIYSISCETNQGIGKLKASLFKKIFPE